MPPSRPGPMSATPLGGSAIGGAGNDRSFAGNPGVHPGSPIIETMLESGVPVGLAKPPPAAATRFTIENVIAVRHWTPKLVSFQTSRAPGFRFTPGHYTRVGLGGADCNLVWRPFSVGVA